jgi:AcrR family transcriptional regulator
MRDLAARADLNPASFYNHFRSKRALYQEVLERGLRPLAGLLDELARAEWTEERADAALDTLMAHRASQPHLPRLILHEAIAGGEHLQRIARESLRPLYARALAALRAGGALEKWEEAELPLLLAAFHHLTLSHFAVAPLLREVFEQDPLSPDAFERQRTFLRKIVRLLLGAPAS